MIWVAMRIIAQRNLHVFWSRHPETRLALVQWAAVVRSADWRSIQDVVQAVGSAKALNGERVRFAICGGNYRLIVAFDFLRGVAYVKFLGTHAEYDRIDALGVSQF
jgi:mRNA interferase HigB